MANNLGAKIVETARALGMNPVDLATIISYETAGTFDPTKSGPTTQWGQHRGLIQFGEPQAKTYGVDWNDPLNSQLGANGAVARYFLDNGWRPGMGMMDAYSIVNAGAPGRYNASDAGNGGAPGTVADKVNNQMAGHRAKAEALLGFGPKYPAADPQSGPLSMGVPEATKSAWDVLADMGRQLQPEAPPMQLMPIQRNPYTPNPRQDLNPYLQFIASMR